MTDLIKRVEEYNQFFGSLNDLLLAMAKQIEANEAEIERLKTRLVACQSIQDDDFAVTENPNREVNR